LAKKQTMYKLVDVSLVEHLIQKIEVIACGEGNGVQFPNMVGF